MKKTPTVLLCRGVGVCCCCKEVEVGIFGVFPGYMFGPFFGVWRFGSGGIPLNVLLG